MAKRTLPNEEDDYVKAPFDIQPLKRKMCILISEAV